VPLLTQESYNELGTFYNLVGGGCRNPIDTGNMNRRQINRILEILERDANIDNLVLLITGVFSTSKQLESDITLMASIRERSPKPVMAIFTTGFSPEEVQRASNTKQKLQGGGVPTFIALERGARALRNALDYYRLKSSVDS